MNLNRPDPRKANDGAAVAFMQFVKDAVVFGDDLLKHLRRDRDFIVGICGPNENHISADFNVWRFLRKITFQHVHSQTLLPERGGIGTNPETGVKVA